MTIQNVIYVIHNINKLLLRLYSSVLMKHVAS